MALARNFKASSGNPNEISLTWNQPLNFNNTTDELIITKTVSHFPVELENTVYPESATDVRPIEIFRGSVIVGTINSASVGSIIDTSANFPTSPSLAGRLVRDGNSKVYRILSNTATELILDTTEIPSNGGFASGFFTVIDYSSITNATAFEVDGTIFTEGVEWVIGTNNNITANNIADAINNSILTSVQASVSGDVVTIQATSPGISGNSISIAFPDPNVSASGSFLVGGAPPYVILADFPQEIKVQQNFETDIRTEVGEGFVRNLVKISNGDLIVAEFLEDELANLIYTDGAGTKRVIKSNTRNTIYFYDNSIPVLGAGTFILNSFSGDTQPLPYIDNFLTEQEATNRSGSGLRDNKYYYYTIFSKPEIGNVAQAQYGSIDSGISTQASAISVKDRNFGKLLYNYWPSIHRDLDSTGDLEDLMKVFGFQFQEIHALIESYRLQDTDNVFVNALPALADQTGLPSVGFSIGADTLRRIARDMLPCWKIKGSKEGIGIFIRKITTWDITDGTGDWAGAILDFLPNVEALRFFDPNLGTTNTRITQTEPAVVTGGRFAQGLPGIVIPGFFTFREFVVTLPNVALIIGNSTSVEVSNGNTIFTDTETNFGQPNSLIGNFLIPNEAEVNDIFEIVSNTTNTVTVKGVVNNKNPGGKMVILSPLNKNRFLILNTLLPVYVPYGTKAGFTFVNT